MRRKRYSRQLLLAVVSFSAVLQAAVSCNPTSNVDVKPTIASVLSDRELKGYYGVSALEPPLPELGESAPLIEPLTESVAVLARSGIIDSDEGEQLVNLLAQTSAALTPPPPDDSLAISILVQVVRALELVDADSSGPRSLLFPAIRDRVTLLGGDVDALVTFGDELEGMQYLRSPSVSEVAATSSSSIELICEVNRERAFAEMLDVESFRNIDQVASWFGADCDLTLSPEQFEQAAEFSEQIFGERIISRQAPLFNLHHADWFAARGLLSASVADESKAIASSTVRVPTDEYDIGSVGYAILRRGSPLGVVMDRSSLNALVLHARGRNFFIPSQVSGELVLLADLNRLLGLSDDSQIEAQELEPALRWALGAAAGSGVAPLSDEELRQFTGTGAGDGLGFTAGIAAVRYSKLQTLPPPVRCEHALAVDLTATRQLSWVVEQLSANCGAQYQALISDQNDGTLLSTALLELDQCLGIAVPLVESDFQAPTEDEAMQMHVDQLWAITVPVVT